MTIFYEGKEYETERQLFDDKCEVEGLSFDTYQIRRKRLNNLGEPSFTRKEALTRELSTKNKGKPITYKLKEYSSRYDLFHSVEEMASDLTYSVFNNRLNKLIKYKKAMQEYAPTIKTMDDMIFVCLNANKKEPLNLHIEHYIRNVIKRKSESEDLTIEEHEELASEYKASLIRELKNKQGES
jgi:hypothetical protein